VEQQQELLVYRRSSIERFLRSRSARREGFLELEESRLTCIFASITIRQTQRSAFQERSLAIHRLFDLGLEGVADQTGYQPTQRDMFLLSEFAKMAQEIVGQDNEYVGTSVHSDPPSAIIRRRSDGVPRMDKV
jgi:hypothetical protein